MQRNHIGRCSAKRNVCICQLRESWLSRDKIPPITCRLVITGASHRLVTFLNMATSLLTTVYNSLSLENVLLLLVLLFLLHYIMVLYEFRDMPPGPRLTCLPVLGNIFSLDPGEDKLTDAFKRSVITLFVTCLWYGLPSKVIHICVLWNCSHSLLRDRL